MLGVLKRFKHLLPVYARKIYVVTMVIPIILEYGSIVWGDKNNRTVLMNSTNGNCCSIVLLLLFIDYNYYNKYNEFTCHALSKGVNQIIKSLSIVNYAISFPELCSP